MFEIRVIDYGDGLVVCSDELDIDSSEVTKNEMWLGGGHLSTLDVSIEITGHTIESTCYTWWEDSYGEENEIFILKP